MEHSHSCQYWQKPEDGPTEEQYNQFLQDTQWAHFVTRCNPPWIGVNQCLACLEYTYYKPNTPRNDMFIPCTISWEGEEWFVISIPADDQPLMEEVAEGSGLQVLRGTPVRSINQESCRFPFFSSTMYTIVPQAGLDDYVRDSYLFMTLLQQEQETIKWIRGEQKNTLSS